ncbi:unnamed protein product, partial [Urochloa humidicola]
SRRRPSTPHAPSCYCAPSPLPQPSAVPPDLLVLELPAAAAARMSPRLAWAAAAEFRAGAAVSMAGGSTGGVSSSFPNVSFSFPLSPYRSVRTLSSLFSNQATSLLPFPDLVSLPWHLVTP